jgi:hypothetical protein
MHPEKGEINDTDKLCVEFQKTHDCIIAQSSTQQNRKKNHPICTLIHIMKFASSWLSNQSYKIAHVFVVS